MCWSLVTLNVHHKDRLTYSGGTDRPGELCYNLSIPNYLTQMVNFQYYSFANHHEQENKTTGQIKFWQSQ